MASASNDMDIHVVDMKTRKELYRLMHDDEVRCVSFHNDLIISASSDKSVRIWKKSTGEKLHSLVHEDECWNFDLSPNCAFIAVAQNKGVSIWSLASFKKVAELNLGVVSDVRFQTNDKIIAALHEGHVYLIKLTEQ